MLNTDVCKMSILYITNDESVIESVGKFLYQRYQQHEITFIADNIDALVHLSNTKPDICVVDMNIPAINLSVVTNELSKRKKLEQTIFIYPHDTKVLFNYDFKYFLSAPVSIDKLCLMIDTLAEEIFWARVTSFH